MGYDIFIADYKKTKVLKLPIIPKELPAITRNIKNEEFETYWDGNYSFIEKPGLNTLTIESWLPTKKYYFAKSSNMAIEFIDLFNKAIDKAEPIQVVIISSNGSTYINDKFSIENGFKYSINKLGDYDYSLPLKQYREIYINSDIFGAKQKSYVLGWNKDGTGWWYCTDISNYIFYKDSWQQIDGEWYSFDSQGYARQSTWLLDGGYWFYLKDNCMAARNEWLKIDGKSYYFGDQGGMYANTQTPDGYWVDANGAWIES